VLSIVLSLCIFISVLFWLVPLWRAESNIKLASKLRGDNANIAYVNQKKNLVLEAINLKPNDLNYRIMAADYLTELGELELARQQLQRAIEIDPRSYESIIYLAQVYERAQLLDPAIKLRISATNKDKFDTRNWLQLGINLAAMGDYASVTRVIESVRSFDNKNPILEELDKLIPKQ
jgi:tetratricopeptide (TPR) repeat protein